MRNVDSQEALTRRQRAKEVNDFDRTATRCGASAVARNESNNEGVPAKAQHTHRIYTMRARVWGQLMLSGVLVLLFFGPVVMLSDERESVDSPLYSVTGRPHRTGVRAVERAVGYRLLC